MKNKKTIIMLLSGSLILISAITVALIVKGDKKVTDKDYNDYTSDNAEEEKEENSVNNPFIDTDKAMANSEIVESYVHTYCVEELISYGISEEDILNSELVYQYGDTYEFRFNVSEGTVIVCVNYKDGVTSHTTICDWVGDPSEE